jgi:hypothetical protein
MIRTVSLINGEMIIGETEDLSDSFKIINPFYIIDDVNENGISGSKLTNVLTFSASDYIVINKNKVVFDFPVSKAMSAYYERLVSLYDKRVSEEIVNEALREMDKAEKRYEKLMSMLKPNKSQLN